MARIRAFVQKVMNFVEITTLRPRGTKGDCGRPGAPGTIKKSSNKRQKVIPNHAQVIPKIRKVIPKPRKRDGKTMTNSPQNHAEAFRTHEESIPKLQKSYSKTTKAHSKTLGNYTKFMERASPNHEASSRKAVRDVNQCGNRRLWPGHCHNQQKARQCVDQDGRLLLTIESTTEQP